jgi:hypothetical protein
MPSQWALQYFDPSAGTQLQAGFAHFFGFAMMHPSSIRPGLIAGRNGPAALYVPFRSAGICKSLRRQPQKQPPLLLGPPVHPAVSGLIRTLRAPVF